jgi:S-formylglutathione hydrolase FrmB
MKTPIPFALALCCAVATADAQREGGGRRRDQAPVELEHYTHRSVEYEAPSIDGKSNYGIYLPPGYDDAANRERTYPWVIWLHGFNENAGRFHSGGAKVLDTLAGEKAIPDLVLVAANASPRTLYLNGESGGDFEDLILKDLTAHVEANYRVAKEAERRAIMGVSMGGMGALKMALRHPDMFHAVAVHSSAILPADPKDLSTRFERYREGLGRMLGLDEIFGDPIDEKKWAAEMPMALVRDKDPKSFASLRIYFDAGTDDRYGFAPPNEELAKLMTDRGIAHTFELVQGGGHSWGSGSLQKQLVKSLQFVGEALSGKAAKLDDVTNGKSADGAAPASGKGK